MRRMINIKEIIKIEEDKTLDKFLKKKKLQKQKVKNNLNTLTIQQQQSLNNLINLIQQKSHQKIEFYPIVNPHFSQQLKNKKFNLKRKDIVNSIKPEKSDQESEKQLASLSHQQQEIQSKHLKILNHFNSQVNSTTHSLELLCTFEYSKFDMKRIFYKQFFDTKIQNSQPIFSIINLPTSLDQTSQKRQILLYIKEQAQQKTPFTSMDDQAYYLQTAQQAQQTNLGQAYQAGLGGYPQPGHQMSHIQYQNPSYQSQIPNPNIIDYSVHPSTSNNAYHNNASHYAGQIHGFPQSQDPYIQQPYQQPYDYDPTGQISGLPYYGTQNISQDPTTQAGGIGVLGIQQQTTYGQYSTQIPPTDTTSQQTGYGSYHPAVQSGQNFGQNPGSLESTNFNAFGSQNQYGQGAGYLPFNSTVQPLSNGQINPQQYGLIQNPNQIGIIDTSLQNRSNPSLMGKVSIKNEEQFMDNELHLLNSIGDSQSQADDKNKQPGSGYLLPSQYDQQYNPAYYQQPQGQYLQGYTQYPSGQIKQIGSQGLISNQTSQTNLKDDPSKRQPNSPGRKKTIKKGSPTGNTEPSSPASPRGRKKKGTIKDSQLPDSSTNLAPNYLNSQQPQQFGLHLVKVPSINDPTYQGQQPYYQQMGKVLLDPNTQQISGIDQNSLQRLKELPTDFNMNEFVYDEQKLIGTISKEERKQKIKNYQEKKKRRSWQKKISYDVRKKVADGRLRVKGRFVTKKQAMEMLSIVGKEEDYTMDQLKEMLKQRGVIPSGGDEESKSPTLPKKKKNQSQPGTMISIKPIDDDEDDGYGSAEIHSEELPPSDIHPIIRGKSCENIMNQYYPSMINANTNKNNINENLLNLKLEQKDLDNNKNQMNQQQPYKTQLQQQQSYNSHSQTQSQSPVRSPNKNKNANGGQSNNTVKFLDQQQQHINQNTEQKNINQQSSYADLQNGESPQHSQSNILSQEMADQFGNLNIKSPDLKQKMMNQKNKPQQLLNLNEAGQQFFSNQQNQNQYQYNQQYNSNNGNNGYPIQQTQ